MKGFKHSLISLIACTGLAGLALLAACSNPQPAASPASQSGLVETIVAGTLQAFHSATPAASDTPTATPAPVIPAGWIMYKSDEFGLEFAHPGLYDCKDQCGMSAFINMGDIQHITTLAIEKTLQWGTDSPFDGISFDVFANPEAISLQDLVEREKQASLQGPGIIGPPIGTSPYEVGGQTGIKMSLQGSISAGLYIPFPSDHQVLIISISNVSDGSFETTAEQILNTLNFTR